MDSVVGFTVFRGLPPGRAERVRASLTMAMGHLSHLKTLSLRIGESTLELFGHGDLSHRMQVRGDGTVFVLIGSPHGKNCLRDVEAELERMEAAANWVPPWDGRLILLRISADGRRWEQWNDWIGSIPVYYAQTGRGWIASSLEPVVVNTTGLGPQDIHLPSLLSLLINGHYVGESTLFKGMNVVPPDSFGVWDGDSFCWRRLWSVRPSTGRWEKGWNELVDELHQVLRYGIGQVLQAETRWILPLSGGLDSRLIAAVGAEAGADLRAYSWGGRETTDVVCGREVAKVLGLPWRHIDLERHYLTTRARAWCDIFGSALPMHGMYQVQFFEQLKGEPEAPVVHGYLGGPLSGNPNAMLVSVHSGAERPQLYPDGYAYWLPEEVKALVKMPVEDALEEVAHEMRAILDSIPGALFQKVIMLDLWTRQRRFIGFSAMLSDIWKGVTTPYLSRDYGRFCLSLPRAAMDRRLLADLFRRHYGRLAVIPGSYRPEPFILTGRYLVKRRLGGKMPPILRRILARGTEYVPLTMDLDRVRSNGWEALWPIREAWTNLCRWMEGDMILGAYEAAMLPGDKRRIVGKLQAVQTLAYRLLEECDASGGTEQSWP